MNLKNKKTNKDWGSFAKGYLKLAERGFIYILDSLKKNKNNFPKESKITYDLEDGSLIIASIWNIKHGLELVVKALNLYFGKQYWTDHSLSFLFSDLKNKIDLFSLKRDIDMLETLVNKYDNCKFLDKEFNDKMNDYFRYLENEKGSLDYSFVHKIKDLEINQFLNDIHNIKRAYELLESEIDGYKSEYKLNKKDIDDNLLSISTIKNSNYKS